MAHRQGVHVDDQHLVALQLHIFGMVIPVDHMVVIGHGLHQSQELFPRGVGQTVRDALGPLQGRVPNIRELSLRHQSAVDLFEQRDVFPHAPVQLFRLGGQDLRKGAGVEQLEHGAVAVPHLHHVVGDGGGDPQDQRQLCHLPLVLYLREGVHVLVDLDHRVPVDAVYDAVGATADLLAALDGHRPIRLFHRHHRGKPGHFQYVVDPGADVYDPQLGVCLSHMQDRPQAGAGYILQAGGVQHDSALSRAGQLRHDILFDPGRVFGVDAAG